MAELAEAVDLGEVAGVVEAVGDLTGLAAPKPAKTAAKSKAPKAEAVKKEEKEEKKVDKKLKKVKQPKTISAFWRSMDKNPEYFTFTSQGNPATRLRFDAKGAGEELIEGPPDQIFELNLYTPINREDIDVLWATRQETFETIYQSIEAAKD